MTDKSKILFVEHTGCDDQKAEFYMQRAEAFILSETNRTEIIPSLEFAVIEYAIILFNRDGMEGESSRSEGGISVSIVEIPSSVQRAISMNRLARVGGHAFEKKNTTDTTTT